MILIRAVLAKAEKVRETTQDLMRSHWPGGEDFEGRHVPERPDLPCRAVRALQEHEGIVWLEAIYEG